MKMAKQAFAVVERSPFGNIGRVISRHKLLAVAESKRAKIAQKTNPELVEYHIEYTDVELFGRIYY